MRGDDETGGRCASKASGTSQHLEGRRPSLIDASADTMLAARKSIATIPMKLGLNTNVKTVEEQKVDEMAEIIRMYRDVQVEEEEEEEMNAWVDHPAFDLFISFIILANSIVIGIETDVVGGGSRHWAWLGVEIFFCIMFFIEIVCKCWYHTCLWIIEDIWNFVAVSVALLALVDVTIACLHKLSVLDVLSNFRMLSLLRVIGLVRLLRIINMYRNLKELRLVIKGLLGSLRMLFWVVLICFLFLYVSSVFMTTVVGHDVEKYGTYRKLSGGWDHEVFFGTILRSMYTLVQVMTLDGWSSTIARHVIVNQWYLSVFFIAFLLMTTYGLLNLVVSVIVEQILAASQSNENRVRVREERARRMELESIREIFFMCDTDSSGDLECSEFLSAVQDPEVQWKLRQLELPVDDALRLFQVIDGDGSRSLTLNEFIDGCTKLKGPARSKDLLAVQASADTLAKKMDNLGAELQECERMLAQMEEVSERMDRRFGPTMVCSRQKIASSVGGSAPVVPIKGPIPGSHDTDLSIGNRPALPSFPNLLK